MTARRDLPDATVGRLPAYLQALGDLAAAGRTGVSSDELADLAGVTPAKLRKDLSRLGSYGVRGVGYDVAQLRAGLDRVLGGERSRAVVVVGAGHLGRALVQYSGFASRGFEVVAVLDADPAVVGDRVGEGPDAPVVRPSSDLPDLVAAHPDLIAVVATPAAVAQQVVDELVAAGVRAVLDFAPGHLVVPDGVEVRYVDVSAELAMLRYRTEGPALLDPVGADA